MAKINSVDNITLHCSHMVVLKYSRLYFDMGVTIFSIHISCNNSSSSMYYFVTKCTAVVVVVLASYSLICSITKVASSRGNETHFAITCPLFTTKSSEHELVTSSFIGLL